MKISRLLLSGQWFPKACPWLAVEATNILQNFLKGDEENERADPIYSFDSFGPLAPRQHMAISCIPTISVNVTL